MILDVRLIATNTVFCVGVGGSECLTAISESAVVGVVFDEHLERFHISRGRTRRGRSTDDRSVFSVFRLFDG